MQRRRGPDPLVGTPDVVFADHARAARWVREELTPALAALPSQVQTERPLRLAADGRSSSSICGNQTRCASPDGIPAPF